jgi:hypothetical protein
VRDARSVAATLAHSARNHASGGLRGTGNFATTMLGGPAAAPTVHAGARVFRSPPRARTPGRARCAGLRTRSYWTRIASFARSAGSILYPGYDGMAVGMRGSSRRGSGYPLTQATPGSGPGRRGSRQRKGSRFVEQGT